MNMYYIVEKRKNEYDKESGNDVTGNRLKNSIKLIQIDKDDRNKKN